MKIRDWEKRGYERTIWRPVAEALSRGQHVAIAHPRGDLSNVREACRGFYGFLAKVTGISHKKSCRPRQPVEPKDASRFLGVPGDPTEPRGQGLVQVHDAHDVQQH